MKKGILLATAAYIIWGFVPLYFKLLVNIPPIHILMHRIIWSFAFLTAIVIARKEIKELLSGITPRIFLVYTIAAVIIGINWFTYVWGVNHGFILETSLGYFINPMVSVLLGITVLREIPRPAQWIPIGIAAIGVVYLTVSYGSLPWISLTLATSFGLYGLMKKIAPLPPLQGMTLETGILFIPALIFLLLTPVQATTPGSSPLNTLTLFLLMGTCLVTAIPLLLFSTAAPKIPLATIGLLQYIAPTLQFFIGVFIYSEPFNMSKLIGFAIIWLALILFTAEGLISRRRSVTQQTVVN